MAIDLSPALRRLAAACSVMLAVQAAHSSAINDSNAGGRNSATVPFDLVDNHIVISALLNGKGPFRFVLDTGGNDTVTPASAGGCARKRSIRLRSVI
jgi:hypothetical protein